LLIIPLLPIQPSPNNVPQDSLCSVEFYIKGLSLMRTQIGITSDNYPKKFRKRCRNVLVVLPLKLANFLRSVSEGKRPK
jgi:hypothetical protein